MKKTSWKQTIILTFLIFIIYMFLVGWCTMEGFTGGIPSYSFFCGLDLFGGPGSGFNGIHEIITYLIISLITSVALNEAYKIYKSSKKKVN